MDASDCADRMCSTPASGCPETYSPNISRSNPSRSLVSHSVSGTCQVESAAHLLVAHLAEQVELAGRLGLLQRSTESIALGVHHQQALARVPQRVEGARLDQRLDDLLVAGHRVDLVQEVGEVGVSALVLAAGTISEATTPVPTLRTADSPNRMSVPTGAKSRTEALTSGGSTLIPIDRHSAR